MDDVKIQFLLEITKLLTAIISLIVVITQLFTPKTKKPTNRNNRRKKLRK